MQWGVGGSMLSKIMLMRQRPTRQGMLPKVIGVDYKETFSPTANLTSIRALMQVAAQHDLVLHQMDVKTAYLHAHLRL